MSGLPKFIETSIKISAALIISVMIVYFVSGQYEQQNEMTNKAFDALRESLLSLIPESSAESAVTQASDLPSQPEHEHVEELRAATTPKEPQEPPSVETTVKKPEQDVAESEQKEKIAVTADIEQIDSVSKEERTEAETERPEDQRMDKWEIRKKILESSMDDSIEKHARDIEALEELTIPEISPPCIPENIEIDMKSLDGLISQALELSINDIRIKEDQLNIFVRTLKNAEMHFDIDDLNIEDITDFTRRIVLYTRLKERMKKIGIEMGAEPGCGYHIPKLEINDKLEITGYYQALDCHPELVEKIMARVKELPEWKKLVKK